MPSLFISGPLLVVAAGMILGSGAWPMKLMRNYQFEHWWLVSSAIGLIGIPWAVTLLCCPNPFRALAAIPGSSLLAANLWSSAWGVANVLCGLCFVRIGVGLTTAILTGLSASIGMILPMLIKGSGSFQNAPDIGSTTGNLILLGVALLLMAVAVSAMAGHGREKAGVITNAGFSGGLVLAILAGVLASGMGLSFVYGQAAIIHAVKAEGATDIPATFATWAFALTGGALINVIYPAILITSRRSWAVFFSNPGESALSAIIGLNMAVGLGLAARGMIALGPLGASVGWGIQQATWMLGGQAVGWLSGEWRGIGGRPRLHMRMGIALLLLAVLLLAWTNGRMGAS